MFIPVSALPLSFERILIGLNAIIPIDLEHRPDKVVLETSGGFRDDLVLTYHSITSPISMVKDTEVLVPGFAETDFIMGH